MNKDKKDHSLAKAALAVSIAKDVALILIEMIKILKKWPIGHAGGVRQHPFGLWPYPTMIVISMSKIAKIFSVALIILCILDMILKIEELERLKNR